MTGPTDPRPPAPRPAAALAAAAAGASIAVLRALAAAPAAADAPSDIAAAQTAAALENTTIAVYRHVAALPVVLNLPAPAGLTLANVFIRTAQQHADHLTALNAAAVRLGGKAQTAADEALMSAVVTPGLATLTSALDVATFAAKLELIAAETYAARVATVSDRQLRGSLASIAGVECQHQAVLLAVAALLETNSPELIALPLDPARLAATMPSGGSPTAFLKTDEARPPSEGALR